MAVNVFTTPIYYVNGYPHIGHAYTSIATDVLSRFHKLLHNRTIMITGTDEHGNKVKQSADALNQEVQDFADHMSAQFRDFSHSMNIDYSLFMRTTSKEHVQAVNALWKVLLENGDIYLGSYSGWYSVRDEAFYKEEELVDGKAPTGAPVTWLAEESYFFRLAKYQDRLLEFYNSNPNFIAPSSKLNELVAFVKSGLQDISISRVTCDWGIRVPNDPKHTIYVWFDALCVYLTACGFPDKDNFCWNDAKVIHFLGKDILRFHGVFWPAFLMSANLSMPHKMLVHGWWTSNKAKMSKSLGNVVSPVEVAENYGLEPLRYFLLREVKFGNDGDFSEAVLVERVNADLANNIGNLFKRVVTVFQKKFGGNLPEGFNLEPELQNRAAACLESYLKFMPEGRFQEALETLLNLASFANESVNKNRIWELAGDEARDILGGILLILRLIAICLQPFLPVASALMLDILSVPETSRSLKDLNLLEQSRFGTASDPVPSIFPRLHFKKGNASV